VKVGEVVVGLGAQVEDLERVGVALDEEAGHVSDVVADDALHGLVARVAHGDYVVCDVGEV